MEAVVKCGVGPGLVDLLYSDHHAHVDLALGDLSDLDSSPEDDTPVPAVPDVASIPVQLPAHCYHGSDCCEHNFLTYPLRVRKAFKALRVHTISYANWKKNKNDTRKSECVPTLRQPKVVERYAHPLSKEEKRTR